jgi:hypothetical protein
MDLTAIETDPSGGALSLALVWLKMRRLPPFFPGCSELVRLTS